MTLMDSKEQRKQRVWDTKTTLILDAALKVLTQKGYYETRLEDIADIAGFSKSALYRYYKDKDEIFFSIAFREKQKVLENLTTGPYRVSRENHISENIRNLLKVSFSAWGENFPFLLTMNSFQVLVVINTLHNQKKLMKIEEDFLSSENEIAKIITEMFDSAKNKNEMTSRLDSNVLFDLFQGVQLSKIKRWYQEKKMEDIDAVVEELYQFLSMGLGIVPAADSGKGMTV